MYKKENIETIKRNLEVEKYKVIMSYKVITKTYWK